MSAPANRTPSERVPDEVLRPAPSTLGPVERADVVVVGAGPGGATTAAHLARRGRDVIMIDKESFPRDKVCGDGLTPRVVKELLDLGLIDEATGRADGWATQKDLRIHGGHTVMEMPWPELFKLADGVPGGVFPHLAGGMLLLHDGEGARRFLAHWQRRMVESGLSRDQPALARTVYDLPDLRLVVLNGVWLSDRFEIDRLFAPKHEQPRIVHYSRLHEDLAVARRLRTTIEALLPTLPDRVRQDPDVAHVDEKYRRLTHPLSSNPLTRRVFLAASSRLKRLRRGLNVDVTDQKQVAGGRPYARDAGRLWND